ncbi:MAG: hypothetical protein ACRDNE_11780, partial [Gaiellaceae bacterium]
MHLTRTRALLLASVALALAVPAATASIHAQGGTPVLQQIREHRGQTWRWQRVMGRPLTRVRDRERTDRVAGVRPAPARALEGAGGAR